MILGKFEMVIIHFNKINNCRQLLGDRLSILKSSWEKANEMTNGEIGVRVAWNMVRKHPNLCKNDVSFMTVIP